MGQEKSIYFAGGCFWGMELLMQKLYGVMDTSCGYANGTGEQDANYHTVCTGNTRFRETVKVTYDDRLTSLETLLSVFFSVIDPTATNRQGNDRGTQYQSGIYYADESSKSIVETAAKEMKRKIAGFAVEIKPLENFYPAEEYHQDYLTKHPDGYCHIPRSLIDELARRSYRKPDEETLKRRLSPTAYQVTQEDGTERPFSNPLWNSFEKGIYVDVTTGEPLFSSLDKYPDSCGWPSFSAPIAKKALMERTDTRFGMIRTEVRSTAGDAHLGHRFEDDAKSPNGIRYCINGAALRFVPYEKMREEGYGAYLALFDR
ncbi:MAG: peptide-methionine (R)-S-oxide reductase MsrB [Sphaerochaetaceae bacterium]